MNTAQNIFFSVFVSTLSFTIFLSGCSTNKSTRPQTKVNTNQKIIVKAPPLAISKTKRASPQLQPISKKGPASEGQTPAKKLELIASFEKEALLLESSSRWVDALKYHLELAINDVSPQTAERSKGRCIEIVNTKLNDDELATVSEDSAFGFLRGHAFYRRALLARDQRQLETAGQFFRSVIELMPATPLSTLSQQEIAVLATASVTDQYSVGAILPITGKTSAISQRALRGLEMGLGINDDGNRIKLTVFDSEGSIEKAKTGVESLVSKNNVIAIVGSLLSKTAHAVAKRSDELGVPNVGLSQKAAITEVGPFVFRNAVTSEMLVRSLVHIAMTEKGQKNFAILYPNDPYGIEYANLFWNEVLARGGKITAVQSYSNTETDFRYPIQRLVGTYYGEGRLDEFKLRLKEVEESEKRKSVRSESKENVLPPIVDFDAIFIPDSAKALGQISAMLAYNDITGVSLLGTNLWNTPGVEKRISSTSGPVYFVDSYIGNTEVLEKNRFVNEFKTLYGELPSIIEVQAFDTGLLLKKLINEGVSSRSELARRLSLITDFKGSFGELVMYPDRELQRPIVGFTINQAQIWPLEFNKNY